MQSTLRTAFLLSGLLVCTAVFAQDQGETLFNKTCVACHTVGKGRLIGPDLANVHNRRDEAWIIAFVQSPQGAIRSGDADAVALAQQFAPIVMPDQALSADEIRAILGYIARKSPAGAEPSGEVVAEPTAETATAEDIQRGQDLFVGRIRFAAGGTPCNACHTVNTENVVTGGALAKDLTTAYSRLTGSGIRAMVNAPPFPMMRAALKDKPVTAAEISSLVAFLRAADEAYEDQTTRNYGGMVLMAGLIGLALVLAVVALLGVKRTKKSVNHKIYERQLKSV